jgi:hypothetical protein
MSFKSKKQEGYFFANKGQGLGMPFQGSKVPAMPTMSSGMSSAIPKQPNMGANPPVSSPPRFQQLTNFLNKKKPF